jgi:SAM-dependent methyltransferase
MTSSHRPDQALLPRGDGPGAITPDGCAVEFYAALTPGQEPRIVHEAIPEGATILELGAGAGRVTHALLALGHPVVAVDESPEMLERIHGAETVLFRIQDLDLGRRFDAVLFASYLLNVPDPASAWTTTSSPRTWDRWGWPSTSSSPTTGTGSGRVPPRPVEAGERSRDARRSARG